MEELNWEPIEEPENIKELTESEKKIAQECSDIELELNEVISMIKYNLE